MPKTLKLRMPLINKVLDRHADERRWGGVLVIIEALLLLALIPLLFIWPFVLADIWKWLIAIATSTERRLIVLPFLLAVSFILYLMRTWIRPVYGGGEIIVGIATSLNVLSHLDSKPIPADLASDVLLADVLKFA